MPPQDVLQTIIRDEWPTVREIPNAVLTPLRARHYTTRTGRIPRKDTQDRFNWIGGVFHNDGTVVDNAMLYRGGWGEFKRSDIQHAGDFPFRQRLPTLRGKGLYGGVLTNHYGHFILDSLSRLWVTGATIDFDHVYFHCDFFARTADDLPGWMLEFITKIGISKNQIRLIRASHAVERLIVPDQGFTLDGYAYRRHLEFLEFIFEPNLEGTARVDKIYLSRARMSSRLVVGEKRLEKVFRENGFRIFYPEKHSVQEQVDVISSAKAVVAFRGSALSILYLTRNSDTQFVILPRLDLIDSAYYPQYSRKNIRLMGKEAIVQCDLHYLVDLNLVQEYLRRLGLLDRIQKMPLVRLEEEYQLYNQFEELLIAARTGAMASDGLQRAIDVVERMLLERPQVAERINSYIEALPPKSDAMARLIAALRRGVDLDPRNPGIMGPYIVALACSGAQEEAARMTRLLLQSAPGNRRIRLEAARQFVKLAQYPDAEQAIRPLIEIDPDNDDAHYLLGCALMGIGDAVGARKALRRSVDLNSENAGASYRLGMALKNIRRYRQSERAFRRAAILAPENPHVHYRLGEVLQKRRRYAESTASFDRTLELQSDHSGAHLRLGISQYNLRQYDAAAKSLRRALSLDSKNDSARDLLAKCARKLSAAVSGTVDIDEDFRLRDANPVLTEHRPSGRAD